MKNSFRIFIGFLLAVLLFSSCGREYTCECKDSDGTEVDLITDKSGRKKFENMCEEKEEVYNERYPGTTCEVK